MVCPKASLSALFASVLSCKICILYGSTSRSWFMMRVTELLERSVSWDKRLVDFLGDCSKDCLTVSVLFSVLTDRGRPLRPLMVSSTFPIFLILSKRRFIVRLVGAFLPGKSLRNCR